VKTRLTFALALAAMLAGCAGMMHREGPMARSMDGPTAVAKLEATRGNATTGTVTFQQHGDHVMVHAKVEGLKPGQEHGFHVHEKGDCSSGDGMSTGGHFNPGGKPHGPPDAEHHAGDMPSLKGDAQGRADVKFRLTGVSIGSGAADIVGKGLIVHAMPDDYRTQPTGHAGARIACAVITRH
jgi:Cu-Zn family superoxide dismutase